MNYRVTLTTGQTLEIKAQYFKTPVAANGVILNELEFVDGDDVVALIPKSSLVSVIAFEVPRGSR